jgi:hypothetical protein
VRINLDHRLRESLSFGLSSYYSRSSRSDLDNDLFFDLVNMAPDVDISARDTSGNLAFEPDPISRRANPLYTVATQDRRTKRTRFLGSANARWAPLEWLSFEGTRATTAATGRATTSSTAARAPSTRRSTASAGWRC